MSTSIRPPGSGSAPALGGVDAPTSVEGASEAQGTHAAAQVATPSTQGPAAPQTPTQVWLARLEAGEITRAQAIDGLVAHALEAHGGARLSPSQRSELEAVLRGALLDDPVLSRLLGGA